MEAGLRAAGEGHTITLLFQVTLHNFRHSARMRQALKHGDLGEEGESCVCWPDGFAAFSISICWYSLRLLMVTKSSSEHASWDSAVLIQGTVAQEASLILIWCLLHVCVYVCLSSVWILVSKTIKPFSSANLGVSHCLECFHYTCRDLVSWRS